MLRNFTWEAFRKTGDINAYCLYKDLERIKDSSSEMGKIDVISENQGNSDESK